MPSEINDRLLPADLETEMKTSFIAYAMAVIINRALLDEHIVLINAGTNILRIIPALIVTKEVVDEAIEKIDRAITAEEQANA